MSIKIVTGHLTRGLRLARAERPGQEGLGLLQPRKAGCPRAEVASNLEPRSQSSQRARAREGRAEGEKGDDNLQWVAVLGQLRRRHFRKSTRERMRRVGWVVLFQ